MAAVAPQAAPPGAAASPRWIISPAVDLSLIIGSAAAGYVYLALNAGLHVPITYLWWFWSVGFDGTHIFATASRTYFDREARARHGRLFYGSLLFFFALGPAMVLASLKAWLYLLVGVWAYYHVIRQHYGFMVLYKVKNRDLAPLDNRLDRIFLGVTMVLPPFHRFFIHHPEELGIPFSFPRLETPLWILLGATVVVYLARQFQRDRWDIPKYLLFAAVIPLHWLTFAYMSWQAAVPTVTIVHNLQYHALVWFHNRNRYGAGRSLLNYALVGLAFSALYRIPGFELGKVSDLAFGLFCGFGLTHYYLDSRIWRVRHDPGLRQALQLT
ncbi:MAG TPA: hypothetical protein VG456_05900 [Candidatus Sulfopaludibacter sp.]|jgi:hypothetical protein|nr:hypothetical protein [Candidatus Sulfopaludibacter sp.]